MPEMKSVDANKSITFTVLVILLSAFKVFAQCPGEVNFRISTSPCSGAPVTFKNISTNTATSFIWKWGDGKTDTVSSTLDIAHTFTSPGTYKVTLTKKCGSNTDSKTLDIKIVSIPVDPVVTSSPVTTCAGTKITYTVTNVVAGINYKWSFNDPESGAKDSAAGSFAEHSFTPQGAENTYKVKVKAFSPEGCESQEKETATTIKASPRVVVQDEGDFLETNGTFTRCISDGSSTDSVYTFKFNNQTVSDPSTTYQWNWGDGTASKTVTGLSSEEHQYASFGVKTLTLTATNTATGCKTIYTRQIVNEKFPSASLSIPPAQVNICDQTTVTIDNFSKNATKYRWIWGDGDTTEVDNKNPVNHKYKLPKSIACQVNSSLGYQISLQLVAFNSCFPHTNTSPLNVKPLPDPSYTVSPSKVVCKTSASSEHQLTFDITSCPKRDIAGFPTVYEIDFGDSFNSGATNPNKITINPNQSATVKHNFKNAGKYVVKLTAKNSCGSGEYVDTIYVLDPAIASFTNGNASKNSSDCNGATLADFTPASNCGPFTVDLKNTSTNLTPNDNITWTVVNTTGSGTATFGSSNSPGSNSSNDNLSFNGPGTYKVQLSVSNNCNTSASAACAIIKVKGKPELTGSPATSISGIGGTDSPQFKPGTGNNAGKYVACGSQSVNTINVNNPDTTVNGYTWSITGTGGTANPAVPSPFANNPGNINFGPGNYQLNVTIKNQCGSLPLSPVNIAILDKPVVNAGGTKPAGGISQCPSGSGISGLGTFKEIVVCAGQSINIGSGTTDPNLKYKWTNDGSNTAVTQPDSLKTSVTPVNSGNTNTCTKYYVEADNGACSNKDSVLLVVKPAPTVNIGATSNPNTPYDTTACINQTSFTLPAKPAGGTWASATNPAAINAAGFFNIKTAGVGMQTVTYTYKEAGPQGCTITKEKRIMVFDKPAVTLSLAPEYCESNIPFDLSPSASPAGGTWRSDKAGALTATGSLTTSVIGSGNSAQIIYNYKDANGCSNEDTTSVAVKVIGAVNAGVVDSICQNAPALQLSGFSPSGGIWEGTGPASSAVTLSGIFDPSALNPGNYKLKYIINKGTPCVKEAEKDIVVKAVTPVNTGGSYGPFCAQDLPQNLNATPAGGSWTGPAGSLTVTAGVTSFDPVKAGESAGHILTYTFTNAEKCTAKGTVSIEVKALPPVNAGQDQSICINADPYQLTGFTPTAGGTGIWKKLNISGNAIDNNGNFLPAVQSKDTLVYTFTLPSGCSDQDTLVVTVVPPVQADAGIDDSICADKGIHLFSPGASSPFDVSRGSRWQGPGVVNGTNQLNTALLNTSDLNIYQTYTYFYGGGNCITKDEVKIKIFSAPQITAPTVPANALCQDNGRVVIQGYSAFTPSLSSFDSTSGSWSGPGVSKINGTNLYQFDPDAAGASTTPVDLVFSYTDNQTAKCTAVLNHKVSVAPLPVAKIVVPPLHCTNAPLTVVNQSYVVFGSIAASNWNFGDGKPGAVQNGQPDGNGTYTFAQAGNYIITLKVITQAGCDSTVTAGVRVIDPPVASFTLSEHEGCGPLSVTISDNSKGYDSTYTWNFGNGITSASYIPADTAFSYNQGNITDTVYYIKLDVKNMCGTVSHIDSVIVLPKPIARFGTDKNIGCSPAPFNFNNTSSGVIDGLPTYYTWDFGDGSQSYGPVTPNMSAGTRMEPVPPVHYFTYNGFNDTTYIIKMVAVNLCGTDSSKRSVKVLPNNVKAFFNQNINAGCNPLTVNFTDFSSNSTVVAWDFGDATSVVGRNVSHTFENKGRTEKQFIIKQLVNNGCSYDTTEQTITVYPNPDTKFDISKTTLCKEDVVSVENKTSGINNSLWDFGDGTPLVNNINTKEMHRYDTAGTFTVKLLVKENIHQCPGTATAAVTVHDKPEAEFTSDINKGCPPLTVTFNSSGSSGVRFSSWIFDGENTSVLNGPSHTFTETGIYQVKLLGVDLNNCKDSVIQTIEVYEKPVADFSFTNTDICRYPVTINCTNKSSAVAKGFSWFSNNLPYSTNRNSSATADIPGRYEIKLITSSDKGCKDSITKITQFSPLPEADFVIADSNGCETFTADFINRSQYASTYTWYYGDSQSSSNQENHVAHGYNNGTYSVALLAVSDAGCKDSVMKKNILTVDPKPLADFDYRPEENINLYGLIHFFNTSKNAIQYHWNYGDGVTAETDSLVLSHRYELFGKKEVQVIAVNSYGCTDTVSRIIEVPFFGELYVPDAFTPDNGSEEIRTFKPVGIGLEKYLCQVYDTWGNLIWESDKLDSKTMPAEGWDGTFRGAPQPQNSYVWKIDAVFLGGRKWQGTSNGIGKIKTTGTVTLLR
jgi:large repetitive protein